MIKKYSLSFLLICLFLSAIQAINSGDNYFSNVISQQSTATISISDTQVCQFDTPAPIVTFSGANSTAPYTFTYNINNGVDQTITTNGTNNNASIPVNTSNSGNFTYNLLSVEDDTGTVDNITGASVSINILPAPDTSLNGTGQGSTFGGIPVFRICNNVTSEFTFANASSTTAVNTNYSIVWGDGSPDFNQNDWTTTTHTYDVGIYTLEYTITRNNGCSLTTEYIVFVGSNPAVSLGNPGNTDICNSSPLTFPITGTDNNPPGTIYTVTFNDGSPQQTFNHPPPASITHTFDISSCNTTSSDGSNTYENSFSANIIASNPCSSSSVGVVPIYVSIAPEADFDAPEVACVNTQVCLTNETIGEENNGLGSSCDTSPTIIWSISPNTGYTITSGTLGNDFGLTDPALWTSGSDNLCLNFTDIGTYTVSIKTGNRCGEDIISKVICIEPDLNPVFTTNISDGCGPLNITTNNTTDDSESCEPPTYSWDINYTPNNCGTNPPVWSFTNGTDENSVSPSFNFETAGTYEIMLTATNSCGDFTTSEIIEVKQAPEVSINPISDACGSLVLNPTTSISTCAPSTETITYNWQFPGGTPSSSNQVNPGNISYDTVGTYTISLEVTNSCGTSSSSETFTINETPIVTNTNLDQTICSGASTSEIVFTTNNPNTTFTWSSNNPSNLSGYTASGNSNSIPSQSIINNGTTAQTLIYTVTPELNGCVGSPLDFNILVEPAPLIIDQPLSDEVCINGSTPDLSVSIQGTGTPTYQWYSNNIDSNVGGNSIAGATNSTYSPPTDAVGQTYYYVVVMFATGGCSEIPSETALIVVNEIPQIDNQPIDSQTICEGGIVDPLSVSTNGGAGTPTYQWFSNTSNSNTGGTLISGANNATYIPPTFNTTGNFYFYVEINYGVNGCSNLVSTVSEVIVVEDPIMVVQPLPFQSICQNAAATALEVEISGGLGNISYQWFSNTINSNSGGTILTSETSNMLVPSTATVSTFYYYCVITQDVSGCEVISDVSEVEVTPSATFTSQPASDILCVGETTNDLSVTYSNGTGSATYQWYENTINDFATSTSILGATSDSYTPDVSIAGTTYYFCVVTFSSGGCPEIISDSAEITVNETPNISDANILICSGNTFEHIPNDANGDVVPLNTTYTWSNPVISPVGSVTGASEQLAGVTSISQTLTNTTINPAIVTYTVTPNSGDCIGGNFTVEITVNPSISVTSILENNDCFQSNNASIDITITGGIPFSTGNPYNIVWNGPNGFTSSNEDISNLEIGTYTLDIIDDGGCPFNETFEITEPNLLEFSSIDFDPNTISCFGANDGEINVDIIGGTLPYTINWTRDGVPFSTDEDLNNLGPGEYTIVVSDINNCGPIMSTFDIIEPDLLQVTLDAKTDVLCFGDSTGDIAVSVIGGRPDYTYQWNGPSGFTSDLQNISNLEAGIYNLTVTDSFNCIDTLDVEIFQNDELQIDVTTTEIECYGDDNASITINSISGGIGPYQVEWSNFATGNIQTNLSAGIYTITITDSVNCVKEFPIEIVEAPLFVIDPVVVQMSCAGENDASITLNFQGGVDPIVVEWDDDSTAGIERNNLQPGTYTVTISDGQPCVIHESFTIFDILPLTLSANVTDALDCDDTNSGAINLLVSGGSPPFTYNWSNGAVDEDLSNIAPNNYTVLVTDSNGCEIEGSWSVNRFEPLVLNVQTQTEVDCENKTIDQSFVADASGGVPPYQYNWSSGNVSGLNNEFMSTDTNGLVSLEVEDSQGCTTTFSLNVETPFIGDPNFETNSFGLENYGVYAILDPIQFTNTSTGDFESILWEFGDGTFSSEENPIHVYQAIGNYVVIQTVNYPFGCSYSKIVTLIVEDGYRLIMPDAFTPNEDNLNDFFAPKHEGLNTLEFNIYDTWGSLIYSESGDSIRGWNGKINDNEAENGNYYYTLTAKTFYHDVITKEGPFVFIK